MSRGGASGKGESMDFVEHRRRSGARRDARPELGIGLVEVLVAIVVVSFGVLGMTSLQLTGLKHSSGGLNRSKALMFAENMATRMRINPPGTATLAWEGFDSDPGSVGAGYCQAKPSPYCQASGSGAAEVCGVEELAAFDVWSVVCGDWGVDASGAAAGEGVRDALPGGRLRVDCGATPCPDDAMYTITVDWDEGSARSAAPGTVPDPDTLDPKRVQMKLRP